MIADKWGLRLTTGSATAAAGFDRAVSSYVKYRLDVFDGVKAALAADPAFFMGQVLKGTMMMLAYNRSVLPAVDSAIVAAETGAASASSRERAHLEALTAWRRGALDRALGIWDGITAEHPRDLLALRLAHFNHFWTGGQVPMRRAVEQAAAGWDETLPGFETVLAMRAFAREETGDYAAAEADGRRAVEIDRTDLWATHAVAHVMEMTGRADEGVAWLDALKGGWGDANNLRHHLWWHRALFHLERGEPEIALARYDDEIRNLASPLVQKQPDVYIDLQNAVSLLWRLEQAGIDVGNRWHELADQAERRTGDHANLFTLPHLAMALAADGRALALARLLEDMRGFAAARAGSLAPAVGAVAVPVAEAAVAHRTRDWRAVIERLLPIRSQVVRLGASNAQRDMFRQMLVDAAARDGRTALVGELLAEAPGLAGRRAYAAAVRSA